MTERVSSARYGGLENAAVYDVCTKLLALVAAFPTTDDFEERREVADVALRTALELAQLDPHTPLSHALYALARAIDLYLHFRTPLTSEPGDVRYALEQCVERDSRPFGPKALDVDQEAETNWIVP